MATNQDTLNRDDADIPTMTRWERLKYAAVRPDGETESTGPADDRSVEAIQADVRRANDKERAIGLVAAPVAALVGLSISAASLNYARAHHQSLTVYDELTYVLLGLAALILVTSLLRKRLFQGLALALFGVAVFQLHYTYIGFAAPFVLAGAWYLIRAYRLQRELKDAEPAPSGATRPTPLANGSKPRASKRYTPPAA